MPFCPRCRFEYVEGVDKCPDCDVALVAELPTSEHEQFSNEPLVPVFAAKNEMEATVAKGALEAAGIVVWERAKIIKFLDPFTVGPLSPEELLVLESRAEEARRVLEEALEAGKSIPPDDGA